MAFVKKFKQYNQIMLCVSRKKYELASIVQSNRDLEAAVGKEKN